MTTKIELIAQLKAENPKMIQTVNDVEIELSADEYEKACNDWAEMRLAQLAYEKEQNDLRLAKISAYEKLGLSATEIEVLLPTFVKPISQHNLEELCNNL